MAAVRSSNPFEGDNGLHCIEMYFTYNKYNGNDLWINYELYMTSGTNTNYAICVYAQPNSSLLFRSSITNGRMFVDNSTNGDAYYMYYYNGGSWDRIYNYINYKACLNQGFYKYNAHFYDNKIDFYINGNYYSSIPFITKYFTFTNIGDARSRSISNENNYIKYITLTDQMSMEIPEPPYTLDEKNNELYGYLK